jgi:hypothetical protein
MRKSVNPGVCLDSSENKLLPSLLEYHGCPYKKGNPELEYNIFGI